MPKGNRRLPTTFDIVAAAIAAAVAVGVGIVVRSRHRRNAVPLRLQIAEEVSVVLGEDNRPVLEIASAVAIARRPNSKRFKIQLLDLSESLDQGEVLRFADPPEDPSLSEAYNGFVAACSMRARTRLGISGFKAVRLTIENELPASAATRFDAELRPKRLAPLGVYIERRRIDR